MLEPIAAGNLLSTAYEQPEGSEWLELKRECLQEFCAARCALGAAQIALKRCRIYTAKEAA